MVCREQIGRIVVTFNDRLLRFGYKLFEKMCKEDNVQIVVYADEQRSEQESKDLEAQELEDLLSIVNVFVDRRNGKKAGILRRLRREQARKEGDPAQRDEDQDQSYSGAERLAQEDVRDTSSNLIQDDCYKLSKKDLAEKYRGVSQKHSQAQYLPDYHLEVPEDVMDETYRDFTKTLDSSLALYKSLKERDEKTSFPCLTFKSRKDNTTSVAIQARSVSSPVAGILRIFPTNFGLKRDEGFKVREAIPEKNYSIRLQMTREAKFYACIPRVKAFPEMQSNRVCAIDSGVRDIITLYDPGGLILGVTDCKNKIFQRCLSIDRLQSKLASEHRKRHRYRLKKLIYRMYQRIKCMVKDMHQKCSKWLSVYYDEVLLPKFATSEMTQKQKKNQ